MVPADRDGVNEVAVKRARSVGRGGAACLTVGATVAHRRGRSLHVPESLLQDVRSQNPDQIFRRVAGQAGPNVTSWVSLKVDRPARGESRHWCNMVLVSDIHLVSPPRTAGPPIVTSQECADGWRFQRTVTVSWVAVVVSPVTCRSARSLAQWPPSSTPRASPARGGGEWRTSSDGRVDRHGACCDHPSDGPREPSLDLHLDDWT